MSSGTTSDPKIIEKRILDYIVTNPSMQSLSFPSP